MTKLIALILLATLTACNANLSTTNPSPTNPETQTPNAPQKAQGVWIDVRSADEFLAGHLVGAVNVVHTDLEHQITTLAPNKDTPIHLYCHSGRRAEVARTILTNLGYTNVQNHGGYQELIKKGFK